MIRMTIALVGLIILTYSLSRLQKSWPTYRHHLKSTYGGSLATYTVLVDFLVWLTGVFLGIGLVATANSCLFGTVQG